MWIPLIRCKRLKERLVNFQASLGGLFMKPLVVTLRLPLLTFR
jgi:hypothetical protein